MPPVETQEQPSMLNRVDRLDVMLGFLEEKRGGRRSPAAVSTNSSGQLTGSSDVYGAGGDNSSVTSSPKSLMTSKQKLRSVEEAMAEIQTKGSLFDRIDSLENRLLKLEEEFESDRKSVDGWRSPKASPGKGLKKLVKSCVKGGHVKTK